MKVFLLGDSAAPHTRRWANWFNSNGHEVQLATFNQNIDFGYQGIKIHKLWNRPIPKNFLLRLIRSILILIKLKIITFKSKPDVFHAHSVGAYSWSATLLNLRPRVLTPWGTDILVDINKSKINKWLTIYALRSTNIVTTDSNFFINVLKNLGVRSSKINFVPFGTDIKIFKPLQDKKNNSELTIVSTRTLNPVHAVEDLIDVIPKVAKLYSNIKFIIIGGGSQLEFFKNKVINQGLEEKVLFTGMVDESRLVKILQRSDIYISTSPLDAGLAASTAEAMACSLPVIHPNVADNSIWTNKKSVALYEVRNLDSLLNEILKFIKLSNSERKVLGNLNRRIILARNNLDKNMRFMETLYNELVLEN
jgi:glycosyltransferase involved in cell wall biosynthesis